MEYIKGDNPTRSLTSVKSNPDPELLVGHVSDPEGLDGFEECERHARDFPGVVVAVADGKPRYDHVGVADGFHLEGEGTKLVSKLIQLLCYDACIRKFRISLNALGFGSVWSVYRET